MTLTLTCRQCHLDLVARSEDGLVDLGQRHAQEHGHPEPPAREHLLTRIRRHNPGSPGQPPSSDG